MDNITVKRYLVNIRERKQNEKFSPKIFKIPNLICAKFTCALLKLCHKNICSCYHLRVVLYTSRDNRLQKLEILIGLLINPLTMTSNTKIVLCICLFASLHNSRPQLLSLFFSIRILPLPNILFCGGF